METLIEKFKSAGWQGTVYKDSKAIGRELKNNLSFWCGYKGNFRLVSPEACQWHKDLNDPECQGCSEQ